MKADMMVLTQYVLAQNERFNNKSMWYYKANSGGQVPHDTWLLTLGGRYRMTHGCSPWLFHMAEAEMYVLKECVACRMSPSMFLVH